MGVFRETYGQSGDLPRSLDNTGDRFEELSRKFAPVLDRMKQSDVTVERLRIQDDKLMIIAQVQSEAVRQEIEAKLREIDPNYSEVQASFGTPDRKDRETGMHYTDGEAS